MLIAVVSVCFTAHRAGAQTFQEDLKIVLEHRFKPAIRQAQQEDTSTPFHIERVSEAKTFFLGAVLLYQVALSSQDTHRCNFTPSCSRFGAASLQRAGAIKGVLLTSDRLMRCHGLPDLVRNYPFDPQTGRFIDPLEKYVVLPASPDKYD